VLHSDTNPPGERFCVNTDAPCVRLLTSVMACW
jgi:hypothetical protein